jgi:hypothetical protein
MKQLYTDIVEALNCPLCRAVHQISILSTSPTLCHRCAGRKVKWFSVRVTRHALRTRTIYQTSLRVIRPSPLRVSYVDKQQVTDRELPPEEVR